MDHPLVDCYCCVNHTQIDTRIHRHTRGTEVCPFAPCWQVVENTDVKMLMLSFVNGDASSAERCLWRASVCAEWYLHVQLEKRNKEKKKDNIRSLLPSSHSLNVYLCFGVQFLILPTHNSPLSTCVFVLYPLPSLHPTQPTKTTVCQPRFIIFCSLFQSKIPFFSSSCSPLQATLKPFAQAMIWSIGPQKNWAFGLILQMIHLTSVFSNPVWL